MAGAASDGIGQVAGRGLHVAAGQAEDVVAASATTEMLPPVAVGGSLAGRTVIVTVAILESVEPSLALYVKLSGPL